MRCITVVVVIVVYVVVLLLLLLLFSVVLGEMIISLSDWPGKYRFYHPLKSIRV